MTCFSSFFAIIWQKMKKNMSWKFTDKSFVTFQSSVSGPGEFGHRKIVPNIFSIYLSAYCQRSCSCFQFFVIKKSVIPPKKYKKPFQPDFSGQCRSYHYSLEELEISRIQNITPKGKKQFFLDYVEKFNPNSMFSLTLEWKKLFYYTLKYRLENLVCNIFFLI